MSTGITIVDGLRVMYYPGGKTEWHNPKQGFLANVVKKSIELGVNPDEVRWVSIDESRYHDKPHSDEQIVIQEIKNGGNVLIDAQAIPAAAERINDSPELLDPTARARVHFWLYNIGNVRNGMPAPPYEGEWGNDYNEYKKLVNSKKVFELAPYL